MNVADNNSKFIAHSLIFLATDTASVLAIIIESLNKQGILDITTLSTRLQSLLEKSQPQIPISEDIFRMLPFLLELLKGVTDPNHPTQKNPNWLREVIEGGGLPKKDG